MSVRLIPIAATIVVALGAQDIPLIRDVEVTLTEGTSMAAAPSPDRRWIAIDLLGGIWILPMRGGDAKRLTAESLEARQPTWSPDSESIAFQGYDADGIWHIYVVPRQGGDARALTTGEFDDREPAWSHDGSRIAFSSDRYGGIVTIWQMILATGELRRVSAREGTMPAWSPDDREIAFISSGRMAQTDGGQPRRPVPGVYVVDGAGHERVRPNVNAVALAWSADGSQLGFITRNGALVVVPSQTGWVAETPTTRRSLPSDATALSEHEDVF